MIQSGPWAITLGPGGACCWFVEYYGNKVGHLNPTNGTVQEWTIPKSGANPYGLTTTIISGSLVLWGTELGSDTVFAFWPDSGTFREYALPYHNTGVAYISAEPGTSTRIWFTETIRNVNGEFVYDPATGNVTLYEDRFPGAVGGGAYGVYAGSTSVWFAGFSALVRWDRASLQYTIWPLPVHGSAVGRFVTVDSYGQAWYTQGEMNGTSSDNFVGVLRGDTMIQEWRLTNPGADPRGISVNPATQQPWLAERSATAGSGTIATLTDPSNGTVVPILPTTAPSAATLVTLAPLSSQVNASAQTVTPVINQISSSSDGQFAEYALGAAQPSDAVIDSAGNSWFSEPGTNKIARLSQNSPNFALTVTPAVISLVEGQSGTVAVTGTSIAGYDGQATLTAAHLPLGVTVSFKNPLNVQSGRNDSSDMLISVAANAPLGTISILIQANSAVIHTTSLILTILNSTITATQKPQCLIATATYGSELSPEVQLLRNFRDNVLKSKTGSGFLILFNTWYYSFSPYVADYLNGHVTARAAMKVILYPLIGFMMLSSGLYAKLSAYPETATVLSGLLATILIGAFYIGLPLGCVARRLRLARKLNAKLWVAITIGGVGLLLISQVVTSTLLMMISASITVLSTLFSSATLTSLLVSKSQDRKTEG
jgi:peptide/nickel transport system substrate-binding protein